MEIKLTYEYVKKEIDKLTEPQDKLDRSIELLAEYNVAKEIFNNDWKTNVLERTESEGSKKAKAYLESVIDSYKKITEKPKYDDIYTVKSLAKLLNISNSKVYKLVENNEIRYSKPTGGKIYFTKADVDEYLLKEKSFTIEDLKREAAKHILTNRKNKSGKK